MRAMFLEDDDDGILGLFTTHPPAASRHRGYCSNMAAGVA